MAVLEGGRLASGSYDDTVKIWEVATGVCEATLEGHEDFVTCLAKLDGGRLASGSRDETVKIWEVGTGACLATLEGHGDWVNCLEVLDGGRLAPGCPVWLAGFLIGFLRQ